jgi:hypothetical protein
MVYVCAGMQEYVVGLGPACRILATYGHVIFVDCGADNEVKIKSAVRYLMANSRREFFSTLCSPFHSFVSQMHQVRLQNHVQKEN